jgi:hypothetical protein
MLEPVRTFFDGIMGSIIGGSGSMPVWVAALIILMLCVTVLLVARIGFEVAILIVAPGVIIASFAGFLPMMSFGVLVILLAVFWTAIILSFAR